MWPSLKPSQRAGIAAAIDPQSSGAVLKTAWIDASQFGNYLAIVQAGALGAAATVDASFLQAQDAIGTGAKAVANSAITTLTKVGTDNSSTQSIVNLRSGALDQNNGFRYIQLVVTPAVAASLVAALVIGVDQHYGFASDSDAASVLQIVG